MNQSGRGERILERLTTIVHEQSGFERDELSEHATFLEIGFDSLFLTQLAATFQNEFGLRVTFRQLFDEFPTMAALSTHLDAELPAEAFPDEAPPADLAPEPVPEPAANPAPAPPATANPGPPPRAAFSGPVDSSALSTVQAVMEQQLELISQQLQMLQTLHGGGTAAAAAAPAATTTAPAATIAAEMKIAATATPEASGAPTESASPSTSSMPSGFGPGGGAREKETVTPVQRQHLDSLIERYSERTAGSKRLTQQYRLPHADPRTAAGFNRLWKEMVYPIVVKRSLGSRLWDVDDNEYIDILNGFGPNFLGHSPPFITEALKAQLDRGVEVGPQTPLVGEVSELFCEMTGMDRVSFVNTGSEAVQAATRLARTMTGRNKIVVFSGDYHGNFDEVLVRVARAGGRTLPLAPGIPPAAVENVLVLEYGAEESLDAIRENSREIAAVLVEPVQSRRPDFRPREFLHALRTLTEETGIILVFDEVITGFRICPGGAQEYYGVRADLATYGKIVGGGMPIGVVAGRARFMDTFDGGMWQYGDDSFPEAGVTFFAGTFVRHPMAIAAAHATLNYLKAAGPALQESVNRRTTRFTSEVNSFFEENGLKIHIPHFASQMYIRVKEENELANLLFFHLRLRGVHLLEGFPTYMTAAHSDEDVDALVQAFKESVEELQAAEILPGAGAPALAERSFPLTSPQREVWMASQLGGLAACAFNESDTISLTGPLDADLLERAARDVLGRHQAFHLRFDEEGASQRVEPDAAPDVSFVDLSTFEGDEQRHHLDELLAHEASTPFDLAAGPLVRVRIVRLAETRHLLVLYCHHIVFDGWSAEVVVREIAQVYSARRAGRPAELPPPRPFSEYAERFESARDEPGHEESLRYWEETFRPEPPPPLDLPTDRPHPASRSYRGGTLHCELPAELYEGLRAMGRAHGATMHLLLLSAFQVLLSRLTSHHDLVVGVPAAGQADFGGDIVGYCVNILPVRARLDGAQPFSGFLKSNRGHVLDAFDNQRTSLGEILGRLSIARDPSRLPLIEVVFNCSAYFAGVEFEGLEMGTHENPRQAVYHDLFLNVIESGGRLVVDWDYNADLFDAETLGQWVHHYEVLLAAAIARPDTPVDELPLMTDEESALLRAQWSQS